MKKVKVIIAIFLLLIVIIGGALIIININKKKVIIDFEIPEYKSIDDVVFYRRELTEEEKNDFINIANTMKEKYPGKSILYLYQEELGVGGMKTYRFVQIENGQILDNTELRVGINEDNTVSIRFFIGQSWKEGNNPSDIKISAQKAQEITINYIKEHPEEFRKMYSSRRSYSSVETQCNVQFFQYKSKPAWKMNFIHESYIILDANTGEILDTYFFNGINVN